MAYILSKEREREKAPWSSVCNHIHLDDPEQKVIAEKGSKSTMLDRKKKSLSKSGKAKTDEHLEGQAVFLRGAII